MINFFDDVKPEGEEEVMGDEGAATPEGEEAA